VTPRARTTIVLPPLLLEELLELLLDEDELPLTVTLKFWALCAPQVFV
jgi:hypothetical protein